MDKFNGVLPVEFNENPFKLIGKDWMLITAGDTDSFNTMTASWGGVGVLWNRTVCFVFIRHSRYTKEFVEREGRLTLSFFDKKYRDALNFCGKVSGRDVDKAKECGLTPIEFNDSVAFEEARIVITARLSYAQDMTEDCFIDEGFLSNYYKDGDFHRMYVCEIEDIAVK